MSEELTFGARYAAASIEERVAMDVERRQEWAAVDGVLSRLIHTALKGERVAALDQKSDRYSDQIELLIQLSEEERQAVEAHFAIRAQEKRGSWHVPKDEKLSLGLLHLGYWLRKEMRLGMSMAEVDSVSPTFADKPLAVAIWVLEPLFEQLYLPLRLRTGKWLGAKTREEQEKQWAIADPLYRDLGLDLEPLESFRPGQWGARTQDEVIAARQALIKSWSRAPDDVGDRYRAHRLGQVVERYYAKARGKRSDGKATRKQVLTGPMGRTLTAYFGGDWLAFLTYLGEEPHPNEQVIQALPKTRIVAGTSERAADVAAAAGVSPEQVQEMLNAYWQQSSGSPIEQRVETIKRYWEEFDRLHAEQGSRMKSLVHLAEDPAAISFVEHREKAFRVAEVLPEDLLSAIGRLWGTEVLPRWPERLVSSVSPLGQMVGAIGPALRFWEGAALTAWYMACGPSSRTTLSALSSYHGRELQELEALGCPVSRSTLQELKDAEQLFGAEEPIERSRTTDSELGITTTTTMSIGTRRAGFEAVRDVITRHRRAWTEQHWEQYIRARWESDLLACGEAYHRETAKRGKSPTIKQFAKAAAPAANAWFAGKLSNVYAAIGIKSPLEQTEQVLLPEDRRGFVERVFTRLGGQPQEEMPQGGSQEDYDAWGERQRQWGAFVSLANQSLTYVQIWEALGEPPELKQVGRQAFERRHGALADDLDEAWRIFGEAVQAEVDAGSD